MLRKLLLFIFAIIYLFFTSSIFGHKAFGANDVTCSGWAKSVARDSDEILDSDKEIRLHIDVGPGTEPKVLLLIKAPGESGFRAIMRNSGSTQPFEFNVADDQKIADVIGRSGDFHYSINTSDRTFKPGNYTLAIVPPGSPDGSNPYCTLPNFFEVKESSTGPSGFCSIAYDSGNTYTIKSDGTKPSIKIKVSFPLDGDQGDDTRHHHSILLTTSNRGTISIADNDGNAPSTQNLIDGWTVPYNWSVGTYNIVVKEHTGSPAGENRSCVSMPAFEIGTQENGGGGLCEGGRQCDGTAFTPNASLSQPCKDSDLAAGGDGCKRIYTAFGYVSTSSAGFTRWVLGFVLSISGGIVILIIIISGYKLMTSSGDPEKVKNARDQLTAAIVGLLFIIFSLALLELITRDVLGLPGFGS